MLASSAASIPELRVVQKLKFVVLMYMYVSAWLFEPVLVLHELSPFSNPVYTCIMNGGCNILGVILLVHGFCFFKLFFTGGID